MIKVNTGEMPMDFEKSFETVRRELEKALLSAPKMVRAQAEHLSKSRGKFIRAASLLACAEDNRGNIDPDAVRLAVSIELLHLATLVHDDVIDDADMRRGQPTVHRKFGKHAAVIGGDYLFCMALKVSSDVRHKEEYLDYGLPDYMGRVCLGELRQNMNNRNFNMSVIEYLRIISGKTAALFEAGFHAGAMLCDDAKNQARLYSRLGYYTGMIFQLTDDCIDYELSQERAKKPVLSDFEQGVITLPLLYTFRKDPAFLKKVKTEKISKKEINEKVHAAGGVAYTRSVSRRYYEKAGRIIDKLDASREKKERLTSILEKAYKGLGVTGVV
jgi:heptaprenyl diphosphate synthase